jgi:hypothetical protein
VRNYKRSGALLLKGRVVWATLVQANNSLFKASADDAPALILTSRDPFFDNQIDILRRAARELYELKGSEPSDPTLRDFTRHITSERISPGGLMLPSSLTRGRPVFMIETMIHRRNLPGRVLSSAVFPVLVDESTPAVTLLPLRFWDDDLAQAFREGRA